MGGQRVNGGSRLREAERKAARIAARQHGVATREQLIGAGFTVREIERRVENGRFRALHRGVYLLGPTLPPLAREMAAVLACEPRAALSHRSVAHFWKLPPYPAKPTPIDVTVTDRNPGRHPGLRIHRTNSLRRSEVIIKYGITVTTPTRTLLDVAAIYSARELEQAVGEAFALRLTNRSELLAMIGRHPRRPGVRALRRLLDADHVPARIRSPAEEGLLTLIRGTDLPEPEVNAKIGRWEVDFLWREERLVVEVDGYASHSSPWAFERDHMKTAELQDAGFFVRRISAKALNDDPNAAVELIAGALSPARGRPGRYQSRR